MKKTLGARIRNLFGLSAGSDEFFEELEDVLIEADLGAALTMELTDSLRSSGRFRTREQLVAALQALLLGTINRTVLALDPDRLNVFLLLGVNGVGKTTNLAKLARHYSPTVGGERIVLAAGDTFRAAAVEQLSTHAQRLGMRIVKQKSGSDAAAVVFDAVESARARGDALVLADTAGRMHNRTDLVAELEKIHAVVRRLVDDAHYRKILVIDATTGQNALRQAELFHRAVGVDAVLLAKYDSGARGGILIPVARELGIGCAFLGTGEGYDDLRPFDPQRYVEELLAP